MLTMEVRAHSGHCLRLESVQNKILLGGKVVVEATEAEVSSPGRLPHGESLGAVALDQRGDRQEDLVLALKTVLRWAAGFPDMAPAFCEQLPQPLPQVLADLSIVSEATGHQGRKPDLAERCTGRKASISQVRPNQGSDHVRDGQGLR
jgi:hypothetical protein